MSEPRPDPLHRLRDEALALPAAARPAFVDDVRRDDAELGERLRRLLLAAGDTQHDSPDASADQDTLPPSASVGATPLREGPGSTIGPYRLLKQLGEGGFGVVFLAEQQKPVARQVALKVIKLGMDTAQVVARFEQERQALAVMDHPNIARVIDAGATATGRPYFVMELVKGVPIGDYCDRNRLTVGQRLALLAQVCDAVQHAHQKGIIHRDLKPSNLLVAVQDGEARVKVIDFGIAKATARRLTDRTLFTAQEQVIGTLQYMSPEQAEGSLDIDTRTDVYSLGVVLYELLTGSTPFAVTTLRGVIDSEVRRLIREVDPPRPSTRLGDSHDTLASLAAQRRVEPDRLSRLVRGELDWIVMKALEKTRDRRYESASALALDLRRHLAGDAVQAAPPSAAYRLRKFVRRNRAAVVGAAAVGAALLVGAVAFAWQSSIARDQRDRALHAEGETRARAEELQKVADYQGRMLQRFDATAAGVSLEDDLLRRHRAALERRELPDDERRARLVSFERELAAVNRTDAAVALLDGTVLAPSVEAIDAQFADQPLVDASLRTILAVVYHGLGRRAEALALYERAYDLRRQELGDDDPDTLASRFGVGRTLGELGRSTEAEREIRATLAGYERALGEDRSETLSARSQLAVQLNRQGEYAECEALSRDLVERRVRLQGAEHPQTLNDESDLGMFLMDAGKEDEAVRLLRDVADAQRRVAPSDLVGTLGKLGNALSHQGDFAAAEPVLREALERSRRDRGEHHPGTLVAITNLATVLMRLGRLGEAESLVLEAVGKYRRVLGDEDADTLKTINLLAIILTQQGKLADAEASRRELVAIGRRDLGADHPDTIIWLFNLAHLLRMSGRSDEAEPLFVEALDAGRSRLDGAHPTVLMIAANLNHLLREQGRLADAEALCRRTSDELRALRGDDDADVLDWAGNLGIVLRDEGKLDEAEPLLAGALETSRRLRGDDDRGTIVATLRTASLRVAQARFAEVLELLAPIEDRIERVVQGASGQVYHGSLLGLRGRARAGLAREPADFAAAETDLLEAHAVYVRFRGPQGFETLEWVRALVDLYAAWDAAVPGEGYDARRGEWAAQVPTQRGR